MTVYKIRDKVSGKFLGKGSLSSKGRIFSNIGFIKSSVRQSGFSKPDKFEVVEFEIIEKSVTELKDLI